jgi:hypothetical protein
MSTQHRIDAPSVKRPCARQARPDWGAAHSLSRSLAGEEAKNGLIVQIMDMGSARSSTGAATTLPYGSTFLQIPPLVLVVQVGPTPQGQVATLETVSVLSPSSFLSSLSPSSSPSTSSLPPSCSSHHRRCAARLHELPVQGSTAHFSQLLLQLVRHLMRLERRLERRLELYGRSRLSASRTASFSASCASSTASRVALVASFSFVTDSVTVWGRLIRKRL